MSTETSLSSGVPLVVSAPSGAGKTTLCRAVMAVLSDIVFSISHTTRQPRGTERDGVDYHFVTRPQFERLIADRAMLEWAEVHGNLYGTGRQVALQHLRAGRDVLFDIDVQGGRQIAQAMPDAVLLFVLPPSMECLRGRLTGRASDAPEAIERRLTAATAEIQAAADYSYWLVNDELGRAVEQLRSVLIAERLRRVDRAHIREALRIR